MRACYLITNYPQLSKVASNVRPIPHSGPEPRTSTCHWMGGLRSSQRSRGRSFPKTARKERSPSGLPLDTSFLFARNWYNFASRSPNDLHHQSINVCRCTAVLDHWTLEATGARRRNIPRRPRRNGSLWEVSPRRESTGASAELESTGASVDTTWLPSKWPFDIPGWGHLGLYKVT